MGFLGPNGAGKSTTMRILSSFMPPTSGRATVAGFDIFEQSLQARAHLGYMPENVPLYNDMRVTEYLELSRRAQRRSASPHRRTRRRRERALRLKGGGEEIDRRAFQRLPATRRPGRCAGARARSADSRRANEWSRSQSNPPGARVDQESRQTTYDFAFDPHSAGSRDDLQPRHHHSQGHGSKRATRRKIFSAKFARPAACDWRRKSATTTASRS